MTAVEHVVSFLVQKLGHPLLQEAIFLHGVRDQVECIKKELVWMQALLKDADAKKEQGNERVKTWVQNVRDLAFDAEDVVDTYVFKITTQRPSVFCSITCRFCCIFTKLVTLHKLGSEMERIKTTLRSISEKRSIYGIQNTGLEDGASSFDQSRHDRRQTSPDFEEPDLVGFKEDLEILVKQLTTGDRRRCVVSVFGMGGLGKTTFTTKVYNSEDVKKHFDSCAWIYISQQYSLRDLLQKIINKCMVLSEEQEKKVKEMDAVELKCKILEHLKQKVYLIVLDDIWTTEAWDDFKDAFPDSNNGSRILLTTRNKVVALHADPGTTPHELRFLTEGESWELFRKKAFFRGDTCYPEDLLNLGREIVRRCQGLPLAIVVIGGLLSRKEELREWENVHKSISWQFVEGEVQISGILSLSYKDLPSYLKPCFLYLGIFPEDYEFRAKKLIQLWAAEGFLPQRGEMTLEEVGEDCLKELIQRSLIQVARRSSIGDIKSCRMHDVLRDLSISEASEDRFLEVHRGNANASSSTSPSAARRLAVHHSVSKYSALSRSTPRHRSVFLFSQDKERLEKEQEKFLYKGFTLLRVLDLHGVEIRHLPNEIGELIHLRYLGCAETPLESLPSSIGNLLNLQILYVTTLRREIEIPSTIGKMHQLRHLQVKTAIPGCFGWSGYGWGMIRGHPQLNGKSKLQTLLNVRAGNWMHSCLGELANLSELGICLYSSGGIYVEGASELIAKLDNLQSLFVSSGSYYNIIPVLVPFSHLLKLCQFRLDGRLLKLPESSEWPTNLIKLTLNLSHSEQDPLMILEKLKSLQSLKLGRDSYIGKVMACSAEGFPRLESLYLQRLQVEEWRVDEGAMPWLLHLRIKECPELKMLPEGLMHVTKLKKLELQGMPKKFNDRLHEDKGEDWLKIRRIPSIHIK